MVVGDSLAICRSTVSPKFLGPDIEFVNADIIGAELRRANPDVKGADFTAGRTVSARRTALASLRQSFCFETNLASSGLLGRIQRLQTAGYHTSLKVVDAHEPLATTNQW
jgi:predicted ABC-type ATPase